MDFGGVCVVVYPRFSFVVWVFTAHNAAEKNLKEDWWDANLNMYSLDWIGQTQGRALYGPIPVKTETFREL